MGSKGLTKEIIVQEAVALIEESGQWVISLHELARRLQVKTPSLYNHIANTKDLQREVFRCAIHRFVENQKAAIAGKEKDEAIRAFARAYFAFAAENKGLYRLIMSMPLNNDEAEKEMAVPLLETVMELLAGYGLSREAAPIGSGSFAPFSTVSSPRKHLGYFYYYKDTELKKAGGCHSVFSQWPPCRSQP